MAGRIAEAVDHLAAHALGRWPRGSRIRVLLPVKADAGGWPFLAGYFDRLARSNDLRFQLFYPDDPVPAGKTVSDAYDMILTGEGDVFSDVVRRTGGQKILA